VAYPLYLVKLLIRTGLGRALPGVGRLVEGGGTCVHYYSDRALCTPVAELRQLSALTEGHDADAIDLALGEPRFDLVASGSTKLPADRRGSPPPGGLPELRAAVAEHLRNEHGLGVRPADEVLITPGAAGAFQVALDAFVNPGDRVVLFDPTSPLYALALRQRRARIRWIPTWMENGRTRFRLENLAKSLSGARLIVVNAPANPTGGVLAPDDLEHVSWWANRRDVLLFSDEVFARYRYDGADANLGTLPRARERTLTVGSLSKGHALASARVGWLVGHRHLLRPCALTAAVQSVMVPTLCQQIALAALRPDGEAFAPIRKEFESRRRYAWDRVQALGLKPAWPAGAFFLWVPVSPLGLGGAEFAALLRRLKKVTVLPGDLFGPGGAGHIRISYAAEDGRLREGLTRLAEFVRDLQGIGPARLSQAA
jgi:aspartate/methionine/tyrosine aminotransferase